MGEEILRSGMPYELLPLIKQKIIPQKIAVPAALDFDNIIKVQRVRHEWTVTGGWCLVDVTWTKKLADWIGDRVVLSVMSGFGMLERALQDHGVQVRATDRHIESFDRCWTHIEAVNCVAAIHKYALKSDILLMSWAPYDEDAASVAAMEWRRVRREGGVTDPSWIIFIGESKGGCTADDKFFDEAQLIELPEIDAVNKLFPRFPSIHDRVMVVQ
ncbi:MAG: hypothetical protein LBQ66_07705 [Planctomycetaceae bacterium]|jgi:hypothetical protein|nr:hypothetical protein [Planctomycetaceae bacterium]